MMPLHSDEVCALPCSVSEFRSNFADMTLAVDATTIVLYYPSTKVKTQTEYYVYSFSGIVGAVGGSLGMFLGFSFWQFGGDLVKKFSSGDKAVVRASGP